MPTKTNSISDFPPERLHPSSHLHLNSQQIHIWLPSKITVAEDLARPTIVSKQTIVLILLSINLSAKVQLIITILALTINILAPIPCKSIDRILPCSTPYLLTNWGDKASKEKNRQPCLRKNKIIMNLNRISTLIKLQKHFCFLPKDKNRSLFQPPLHPININQQRSWHLVNPKLKKWQNEWTQWSMRLVSLEDFLRRRSNRRKPLVGVILLWVRRWVRANLGRWWW